MFIVSDDDDDVDEDSYNNNTVTIALSNYVCRFRKSTIIHDPTMRV